ncbi:MAG: FHA domain-containing protein [Vicinamibacteria bacterium]
MGSDYPTLRLARLPRLTVMRPDGKEVQHSLAVREVTVGRHPANRICIPDRHVSKFHAKLVLTNDTITLLDLGSLNRTRVNGVEISQASLSYGDQIQFAGVEVRLLPPQLQIARSQTPFPPVSSLSPPARPRTPDGSRPSADLASKASSGAPPPSRTASPPEGRRPIYRLYVVGGALVLVSLLVALALRSALIPSSPADPAETPSAQDPSAAMARVVVPTASQVLEEAAAPVPAPPTEEGRGPTGPNARPLAPQAALESYFDEALSLIAAGRLKEARSYFQKALALDPNNSRVQSRLALLEEQIETEIESRFQNAREAFRFLRYDEAISDWEVVVQLAEPSDPRKVESEKGMAQARAKRR